MLGFTDLFQWERFITPTIIKVFYWLVVVLVTLFGLSCGLSAVAIVGAQPFAGFVSLLTCVAGVVAGVICARVAAEFILIVFRINEHLGAMRHRGDEM